MPFRFPLQAVLHFRQSVEHQQELLLIAINQHVARVRQVIEQVDQQIESARLQQSRDLGTGITSAELCFEILCETAIYQRSCALQSDLARLEKLRDQQQKVYQLARQRREVLESLRDGQLRQYEREASRQEQQGLDDLFLLRRAHLRRG